MFRNIVVFILNIVSLIAMCPAAGQDGPTADSTPFFQREGAARLVALD